MTTKNEAAERLRALAANHQMPDHADIKTLTLGEVRAVLATERRNTVERIRERLIGSGAHTPDGWLASVLDEVSRG